MFISLNSVLARIQVICSDTNYSRNCRSNLEINLHEKKTAYTYRRYADTKLKIHCDLNKSYWVFSVWCGNFMVVFVFRIGSGFNMFIVNISFIFFFRPISRRCICFLNGFNPKRHGDRSIYNDCIKFYRIYNVQNKCWLLQWNRHEHTLLIFKAHAI